MLQRFAFRALAKLRRWRGSALDLFNRTAERKAERALVGDYEQTIGELLRTLTAQNHAVAVEIALLPERIRGFGHVKAKAVREVKTTEARLLAAFRTARHADPQNVVSAAN